MTQNKDALEWIDAQIESAKKLGIKSVPVYETIREALIATSNAGIQTDKFKEKVYELAFGDGANSKGYGENEVLSRLEAMITELPRFVAHVLEGDPKNPCEDTDTEFEYRERLEREAEAFMGMEGVGA